jgi:hypothetical protein
MCIQSSWTHHIHKDMVANIPIVNDHHNVPNLQSMFLFVNFVMEPSGDS